MFLRNICRKVTDIRNNLSENANNRHLVIAALIYLVILAVGGFFLHEHRAFEFIFCCFMILSAWLYSKFIYYQFLNGGEPIRKTLNLPCVSALITGIVIISAFSFMGAYPAGSKSTLTIDMYHQYAPLLNYLRSSLLKGSLSSYSFNLGIGVNFISVFAYYLANPFNAVLVLFPESCLTEVILALIILKICLCAFTFALFLQYTFKKRSMVIPVCAIMYALSAYVIAYSWNIMWLDSLAMLPVVVACLERFIRTGKAGSYIAALAVTLYLNYYIGFMICIFLTVYFIASRVCGSSKYEGDGGQIRLSNGFFKFVLASIVGGGITMFMLLPTYSALQATSAASSSKDTDIAEIAVKTNFDMFDILGRGLFGASPTVRSKGLPNIYCGILTLLCAALFFMNSNIEPGRKFAYGGMLALLLISFSAKLPDLIWHGMHFPNDLPYRFSFIYCFVILTMAYQLLLNVKYVTAKQIAASFFCSALLIMVVEKIDSGDYEFTVIYGSLAIFAIYSAMLYAYKAMKLNRRSLYSLLLAAVALEAMCNANKDLVTLDKNEVYTSRYGFISSDNSKLINKSLDNLEENYGLGAKSSFFRVETLPRLTLSDTALYNYPGITFFSSANYYHATKFLDTLGYRSNEINSVSYRNFVAAADSLLGIKYLITDTELSESSLTGIGVESNDNSKMYTYENTNALPLGFIADYDVLNLNNFSEDYKYNPFEACNALYSAMLGERTEIYEFDGTDVSVGQNSSCELNGNSFMLRPQSNNSVYNFIVTANREDNYYLYVDCSGCTSINVTLPSRTISLSPYQLYTLNVGKLAVGQEIKISITAGSRCSGNIYTAALNGDNFKYALSMLNSQPFEIANFTGSNISGSVNCEKSGVLTTSVPYDLSWKIYVDGEKVDAVPIADALIGVSMNEGAHTVELRYVPKGLMLGSIMSAVSLAMFVYIIISERSLYGRFNVCSVTAASYSENIRKTGTRSVKQFTDKEDFYDSIDDNTGL